MPGIAHLVVVVVISPGHSQRSPAVAEVFVDSLLRQVCSWSHISSPGEAEVAGSLVLHHTASVCSRSKKAQLRDNLLGDVYRLILLQLDLELLTSMPFDGTYHGRGRLTELGLMQNRLL